MKTVVGDADILIALAHTEDANHDRAVELSQKLYEEQYKIVFPNTAILEAITALKRKPDLPSEKAQLINSQYQQGEFNIVYIDENMQTKASEIFESTTTNRDTIFDCVVASLARELKADGVLAFDSFYAERCKLTLAQELVNTESVVTSPAGGPPLENMNEDASVIDNHND